MTATPRLTREQQQLVVDNQGLARQFARRATANSVVLDFDDAVGWGNIGLCEAAMRFDASRGLEFSTYAMWWIRHFVFDAIRRRNGVPRSKPVESAFWRLWSDKTSEQLASDCGTSVRAVDDMRARLFGGEVSIDDCYDVAADGESPEQRALDGELRVTVREAIAAQGERSARCLRQRFEDDETLEQIAARIGRSRERVRQIQNKALRQIGKRAAIKELGK
jgi:RNA polymerase sigma factor (sigma-70 family)